MIALQIIAALATIISVVFMTNERSSAWIWGMVGLTSFFFIYYDQKLYLQSALQIVFFGQAIYGFISWFKKDDEEFKPTFELSDSLKYFGGALIVSWIVSMFYGSFTDASSPFIDTWTTALCLLGNFWLAKKRIEGWIAWAVVNIILFFVFFVNKYYISSTVELVLFVLSLSNIMKWNSRR